MSLAIAVRIAGSSVRSIARPRRPARSRRQAEVRHHVHRVGGRAAVAERQQPARPRRSRRAAPAPRRASSSRLSPSVCARSSPTSLRLEQDRAAHVVQHRLEVVLVLGEERIEEARRAGVVHAPRLAPLEQPAVLEEHVHELPEHVVERLHQLLADRRVRRRRLELPLGPAPARTRASGSRARARAASAATASAVARRRRRWRCRPGSTSRPTCGVERAALAGQPQRRQRPLADDHRVHELDGHVAHVGARGRRAPERDQPPAAREALGHPVAEPRQALGLGARRRPALASRALGQRRVDATQARRADARGSSGRLHAARPPASASRATRRCPRRSSR